jgi:hypothetical protein
VETAGILLATIHLFSVINAERDYLLKMCLPATAVVRHIPIRNPSFASSVVPRWKYIRRMNHLHPQSGEKPVTDVGSSMLMKTVYIVKNAVSLLEIQDLR